MMKLPNVWDVENHSQPSAEDTTAVNVKASSAIHVLDGSSLFFLRDSWNQFVCAINVSWNWLHSRHQEVDDMLILMHKWHKLNQATLRYIKLTL